MADAEPALPLPPAPAAPVPEPAPVVAPAPEPAVVAAAPRGRTRGKFHFCHKSSVAVRFWQRGLGSGFLPFRLPTYSPQACLSCLAYSSMLCCSPFSAQALQEGFCSGLVVFCSLWVSCLVFHFF